MIRYVGLDVHKVWTQVAWHLPDGSVQRERIATQPARRRPFALSIRNRYHVSGICSPNRYTFAMALSSTSWPSQPCR